MASVSRKEIRDLLETFEGITKEEAIELIAIADLESEFRAERENHDFNEEHFRETGETLGVRDPENAVDRSYGLWQVNFLPAYGKERAIEINEAFGEDILEWEEITVDGEKYTLVTRESLLEFFDESLDINELLRRNLIALDSVWSPGDNYKHWSTHSDYKHYNVMPNLAERVARHERAMQEAAAAMWEPSPEYLALENKLFNTKWEHPQRSADEAEQRRIKDEMGEIFKQDSEWPPLKKSAPPPEIDSTYENPEVRQAHRPYDSEGQDREVDLAPLGIQLASASTPIEETMAEEETPERKINTALYKWLQGRADLEIDGVHIWDIINGPEGDKFVSQAEFDAWVESLLAQTDYIKNRAEGRIGREEEWYKESDDDEWSIRRRSLVDDKLDIIKKLVQNAGLGWSEIEMLEAAKLAWFEGWLIDDIKEFLVAGDPEYRAGPTFGAGQDPGTVQRSIREKITSTYEDYYIPADQIPEDTIVDWAERIYLGDETEQLGLLKQLLGDQAANLYPGAAERIQAGQSPLDILSSYSTIFGSIMGYMPQWKTDHRDLGVQVLSGELGPKEFGFTIRNSEEADHNPKIVNERFKDIRRLGQLMGAVPGG